MAAAATAIQPAGHLAVPTGDGVSPSLSLSVALSCFFSLPPSHPFLGVVLLLEKEAPAFASSITKKRKIKNTIEKSPTVILEVRKEVKESGFSVPLGGILASKGARVRNDRILILRPGVDILGLNSPRFVSHFIPHSVLPPLLILFPISSFLWLLLFQFIFTYEKSTNHPTLSDIKPFQTLFGQSKTQIYKPSMSQMPPVGFWDLGQVTQDNRSPLPSRQQHCPASPHTSVWVSAILGVSQNTSLSPPSFSCSVSKLTAHLFLLSHLPF